MTIEGGEDSTLQLGMRSLGAAISFTTLKTRWSCFMEYGSFGWYAIGPTYLFTVNRPSL